MNMTTTEKNWLQQFTTHAKAMYTDMLKVRKRDYDGWIPPDVEEMRKKVAEHDGVLSALLRGAQQFISSAKKK
jgi:hypothetical protein